MFSDKNLIFEAYKGRVLLTELPVYAQSSYQDPTKTLKAASPSEHYRTGPHPGADIANYANALGRDPYEVAQEFAELVKKNVFTSASNTVNGVTYDLEYPGSKTDLKDAVWDFLVSEFKKRGPVTDKSGKTLFKYQHSACRFAAQTLVDNVLGVTAAGTTGGARVKGAQAPKVQKVVAKSAVVDDVFAKLAAMKIVYEPQFQSEKYYHYDGSVYHPDIYKDLPDADLLKLATNALGEEADRSNARLGGTPEYHGSSLIQYINGRVGLPYSQIKKLLDVMLKVGVIREL